MEWWIWILLGLVVRFGGNRHAGGFYFIFFGVGAIVVGMLAGFGAAGPLWFKFILFEFLSVLALWCFREKLLEWTRVAPRQKIDSLVGEIAVAVDEIAINSIGKANARYFLECAQRRQQTFGAGRASRVERVQGLTLFVRAESD